MRCVGGKWMLVGLVSLREENKSMKAIIAGYWMHDNFHILIDLITNYCSNKASFSCCRLSLRT